MKNNCQNICFSYFVAVSLYYQLSKTITLMFIHSLIIKVMATFTKTLTASQIKAANPTGLMTMSYIYPNTFITFENGAVFTFDNSDAANKSFAKLSKMGFGRVSNFSSDEAKGIVAADKKGESAFDFKIIAF